MESSWPVTTAPAPVSLAALAFGVLGLLSGSSQATSPDPILGRHPCFGESEPAVGALRSQELLNEELAKLSSWKGPELEVESCFEVGGRMKARVKTKLHTMPSGLKISSRLEVSLESVGGTWQISPLPPTWSGLESLAEGVESSIAGLLLGGDRSASCNLGGLTEDGSRVVACDYSWPAVEQESASGKAIFRRWDEHGPELYVQLVVARMPLRLWRTSSLGKAALLESGLSELASAPGSATVVVKAANSTSGTLKTSFEVDGGERECSALWSYSGAEFSFDGGKCRSLSFGG